LHHSGVAQSFGLECDACAGFKLFLSQSTMCSNFGNAVAGHINDNGGVAHKKR
jgi:hypothetical protein